MPRPATPPSRRGGGASPGPSPPMSHPRTVTAEPTGGAWRCSPWAVSHGAAILACPPIPGQPSVAGNVHLQRCLLPVGMVSPLQLLRRHAPGPGRTAALRLWQHRCPLHNPYRAADEAYFSCCAQPGYPVQREALAWRDSTAAPGVHGERLQPAPNPIRYGDRRTEQRGHLVLGVSAVHARPRRPPEGFRHFRGLPHQHTPYSAHCAAAAYRDGHRSGPPPQHTPASRPVRPQPGRGRTQTHPGHIGGTGRRPEPG